MTIERAERLKHFSEYYFSKKLKEIRQLIAAGKPVINLGIGSPDQQPPQQVIATLKSGVDAADAHGYQPYQGIAALHAAVHGFCQRYYHVDTSALQVLPLMGSKEGITHISLAYLNPGDQVLVPSLGYPTYTSVTKMVGGEPVYYPLQENQNWEPDWEWLDRLDTSKVKIMWINYPHMPTGTVASSGCMERLVAFARARGLLLCHDNPYSLVLNDTPQSIFSVAGAEEVCIELNSLSKAFNMAGWRVGWLMGKPELVAPVLQIKSNMDSGMFKPIQQAAVQALQLSEEWFAQLNAVYRKRRGLACAIMEALGCTYETDQAGMFVWGKVPSGTGEELSDRLLYEHDVFVTPGFIFGTQGKAYIRISLCSTEEVLQEVMSRIA
ncbi:pyridoxal phosphate-dependent aminotransferase [Marinoscillum furvescens]|uniref:Aminotransferase n=1 Tax=Marinoscillum furvescens DSM 4134 TaxID=1122208 RepID=A0A3D9L048_MARFU|nr:aminotransferase class I/II-fold pyridoxal phosphate-dependent enzyme [Marinoscillum furvescens]RED93162.1 aspartate/methionine/tyrosine aminotransferase [Marinoscillum furvescens DSM 4134]